MHGRHIYHSKFNSIYREPKPMFDHDLHTHLYGCLTADYLWQLAKTKTDIDWTRFEEGYEKQYQWRPSMQSLLQGPEDEGFEQFKQIYFVDKTGPFLNFQAKFNLIITIVDLTNLEEIRKIIDTVCESHVQQGLTHAEYRILPRPETEEAQYYRQLEAFCDQLWKFEVAQDHQFQGRLSVGLPRTEEVDRHYAMLRKAMAQNETIAKMTTSIDFCFIEEGYPPKDKQDFFKKVRHDNAQNLDHALAILYHVGESFQDKSLESAIRWVHQSALFGAHRLGHAIALGIPPEKYLGQAYTELVAERIDQIEYDLLHQKGLADHGIILDVASLEKEKETLLAKPESTILEKTYSPEHIENLKKRQNYAIHELEGMEVCIEVCPTSNFRIGMLEDPKHHPLHRFIQSNLSLVLASDDPGIFNTTLQDEIDWVKTEANAPEALMEQLASNAKQFRSENISKRWNA